MFAVCFAFIGIPAFLLSAIGLGKLLNLAAEAVIRQLSRLCGRHGDDERLAGEFWPEDGRPPVRMPLAAREKFYRRRAIYRILIITVVGAGLFVFVPSAIFMQVEDWTYWEAVYYCTITLVTIGFGDFVPGYGDGKQLTEPHTCLTWRPSYVYPVGKQETQLSLTNRATRLEVSQGHQTWSPYHVRYGFLLVSYSNFIRKIFDFKMS